MPNDHALVIGDVGFDDWFQATAADRPVFHSEADLQHHLAWIIRELDPDVQVRLETRPLPARRMAMDLLLLHRGTGERVGVELKYPTRGLVTTWADEAFTLLDQSAQDITRYDICKDVRRTVASGPGGIFRALVITVKDAGTACIAPADSTSQQEKKTVSPGPTPVGPLPEDVRRLRDMVDELRRQRNSCEPKSNQNARYLRYSTAVSSLNWIIDDLAAEHAGQERGAR